MEEEMKNNLIHTLQGRLINSAKSSVLYSISDSKAFTVRDMKEFPITTALIYHDAGDIKFFSGWINNKSIFITKSNGLIYCRIDGKKVNIPQKQKNSIKHERLIGTRNIDISILNSSFSSGEKEIYVGYNDCTDVFEYPGECNFCNLTPILSKYIDDNSIMLYVKTEKFNELISYYPAEYRDDNIRNFATISEKSNMIKIDKLAKNIFCSFLPEIREFLV